MHLTSLGEQPSALACPNILLKQVLPHGGKSGGNCATTKVAPAMAKIKDDFILRVSKTVVLGKKDAGDGIVQDWNIAGERSCGYRVVEE